MINGSTIKLKSLQLTVLVFLLSFFFFPWPCTKSFHSRCIGEQQNSPKGKDFYQCVRVVLSLAHSWVIQILKAFCRALSLISCWVRNSKHLLAAEMLCTARAKKWVRGTNENIHPQHCRPWMEDICSLWAFKKHFLVFVLKQTNFVFLVPWLRVCSEDSALADQGSAPWMCSYSQWCFTKCSEGLGCFNNMFSCKMNSK